MNAFTDIVSAVLALLRAGDAGPAIAPRIERNRLRIQPADVDQAVVVRSDNAVPEQGAILHAPVDWQTSFVVDCYARAVTDEEPDIVVAPLMNAVYARILTNQGLGDLDTWISPGAIDWDFAATGESTVCVSLTFSVQHRTNHNSLESPLP
ncbi:hypothetical protein BH10PSE18_BH10PSE18_15240 [soil metagenome]